MRGLRLGGWPREAGPDKNVRTRFAALSYCLDSAAALHSPEVVSFDQQTVNIDIGVANMGRGILLWLLGVPIPIILLLAMCSHT